MSARFGLINVNLKPKKIEAIFFIPDIKEYYANLKIMFARRIKCFDILMNRVRIQVWPL